jgi:very-short-patch-repair endonuclease
MATLDRYYPELLAAQGWRTGTSLENRVAFLLGRFKLGPDKTAQQHRVGRYRLDFAWPSLQICLEADGGWHRTPGGAAVDAARDAWLRNQGWLVFRVDDTGGSAHLGRQVARVARVVHGEL